MDRWFQHGERGERGRHSERERDRERERKPVPRAAQSGGAARGIESPEGMGRRRGQGNNPHGSLKTGNGLDGSAARSARAIKCPSQDKLQSASDPKRASHGMPMKMLIREEMSKEKELRRTSPNLIARLMGLESLPTPVTKQFDLSDKGSQKISHASLKENRSGEDKFSKVHTPEQQEFKDVFEVFDTPKAEKCKDPLVRKRTQKVRRSNKDIDFIRQKFIEAKRLSTDEKLRCSREFGDALEVLDSNKDIFLRFLQEPNSLLAKHCHDLNSTSSSPHSGHITILKSTKSMNLKDGEIGWKSCGGEFRSNEYQTDVANLGPKLNSDANNSCASKQCGYISNKLEDINFEGELESCTVPTRIVVLKPCLEKIQSADDSASDPFLGYRRHNECISGSKKMSFDIDDSQKMQIDSDLSRHKIKNAREKTRELEETRVTKMDRKKCASASGDGEFFQIDDVGRTRRQGKRTVVEVEAMRYNSGCSHSRERKHPSSPAQSDKHLVSKQARKHLSKQWLVSQNSHEDVALANSGMSTLGDMLAFSDKETHDCGSSRGFNHKGGTSPTPSATSTDSQRHVCSRKLPRSRSLPTSSTVCKSHRAKHSVRVGDDEDSLSLGDVLSLARKSSDGHSFPRFSPPKITANDVGNRSCSANYKREQNHIHVCEASTQSDERWSRMVTIENSHEASQLSSARFFDAVASDDDAPSSDSEDEEITSTLKLDILRAVAGEAPDINCHTSDNLQWSQQELSPSNSRIELSISESSSGYAELCTASKEAEQTSPVSVLDPPEDEETSSLDCFERVNADLRGLRIQLQRLRLERANTYSDGSDLLSDDETADVPDVPLHVEDAPSMCDDEEKRSISYLNDVLSNSGLTGATLEVLFDACYSSEFPLNPNVFDKHEKVYSNPATWSRHERKLLFDLVNLYLKEKLEPHLDQRLWLLPIRKVGLLNGELVPEEVWKSLVGLKEWKGHPMESAVDIRWLDRRDDIDSIGKDLEKMLRDELLDEFIQELVSGLPACVI